MKYEQFEEAKILTEQIDDISLLLEAIKTLSDVHSIDITINYTKDKIVQHFHTRRVSSQSLTFIKIHQALQNSRNLLEAEFEKL